MHFETLIIVTGLADDHDAVREALTAAATKLVMPDAVVTEPVVPPEVGFALVLTVPKPATATDLEKLHQALAAELGRREVLHAELAVELLDEA